MGYVGFWRRLGAYFIDVMFLYFGTLIFFLLTGLVLGSVLAGQSVIHAAEQRKQQETVVQPMAYQGEQPQAAVLPAANPSATMGTNVLIAEPTPEITAPSSTEPVMSNSSAAAADKMSDAAVMGITAIAYGCGLVVNILYHTLFVASRWQATPGKRLVGAKIVRASTGGKVGFFRAFFRHITSVLNWFTCGLLFIMIGVTREKTALHDLICGTRVMYRDDMPWMQPSPVTIAPRTGA